MPCYSMITTKLTDGVRIANALYALGYQVQTGIGETTIRGTKRGEEIVFTKGATYSVSGSTENLAAISRKYAEIGVRQFAQRRGFSVTENDGIKMTLVNRRG